MNLDDYLSLIADPRECAFREALFTLSKKQDWKAWDETRAIFADYLNDIGHPEEGAARADWKIYRILNSPPFRGSPGGPWRFKFIVPIIYPEKRVAIGRFNSSWLLGFTPGSLLMRGFDECIGVSRFAGHIRVTWGPNRNRTKIKAHDGQGDWTSRRPLGFLGMWFKPDVPVGGKEKSLFD